MEGVRKIRKKRKKVVGRENIVVIEIDVVRKIELWEMKGLEKDGEMIRILEELKKVKEIEEVGMNVEEEEVKVKVEVVDEMEWGENSRKEIWEIKKRIKKRLEKKDKVLKSIEIEERGLLIGIEEMILRDIEVEKIKIMIGEKMKKEVRKIEIEEMEVMEREILKKVERGIRKEKDVLEKKEVNIMIWGLEIDNRI